MGFIFLYNLVNKKDTETALREKDFHLALTVLQSGCQNEVILQGVGFVTLEEIKSELAED